MLKRWADWSPGIRRLAGISAAVLALVIVWALFVPVADWLARHDVGSARGPLLQAARDAARGRLLTLAAGLFAAGALIYTARNFALSREGQVTERYTKAIEQLGSDKLDVRIGGIYALERVARDSARDHSTVMEVLTAFIREHSREQGLLPDPGGREQERWTPPDIQAAITVIGRRHANRDIGRINLYGAYLVHAFLHDADLTGARLRDADLTGARLRDAKLTGAQARGAKLTGADLTGADIRNADLTGADIRDADLTGAQFDGANLTGADLHGAILTEADTAALTVRALETPARPETEEMN